MEAQWERDRIMMNGAAGLGHFDRRERVLKLGESFEKHPRCAFHTVRCKWGRPIGVGRTEGRPGMGVWSLRVPVPTAPSPCSEDGRVGEISGIRREGQAGVGAGVPQVWVNTSWVLSTGTSKVMRRAMDICRGDRRLTRQKDFAET